MGRAKMFFEASWAISNTSGSKIYENVCWTHSLAWQNHLQASRKIRFARINADRQSFDPECSWYQLHMDTSSYWKQVLLRAGSCTSELQLKVNCRPNVNCRIIFFCWLGHQFADQPKFCPTIHFLLQFTCTWSGGLTHYILGTRFFDFSVVGPFDKLLPIQLPLK